MYRFTAQILRDIPRAQLARIRAPSSNLDVKSSSGPILQLRLIFLAVIFANLSCSGDRTLSPIPEVSREELLQALTPEAGAAVSSDGRLQLAAPTNTGRAQISGEKAGALAVAMAHYNAPYNNEYYETRRGAPISYDKLAVCAPPLYAATPFERLDIDDPSASAHPLQKALGPVWLVRLCVRGDPEMNVAVSAYSTDLEIASNGEIDFPPIGGNDFVPEAIPIGQIANELPSAEAAVVLAATATGRRVAAVPELIAPFYRNDSPLEARWHLRLDSPARIRTATGSTIESADVYVSRIRTTNRPGSRLWNADAIQPTEVEVVFVPQARVGENWDDYVKRQQAEMRTLHAARKLEMPINFTAGVIAP